MKMAKRPILTTQEYLINAALPEATDTYTVIPHGTIIDTTRTALKAKGLEIERELYRCNEGAQIASGIYHIKYGNDADMGMLFAWTNSYDKSTKFKCTMGGYVHESLSTVVGGNMGSWGRKHTGNADNLALNQIDDQIKNADTYFAQLIAEKEIMKTISTTEQNRAELMGRIYFIHELLTGEQLSLVKQQFENPSFTYSGVDNSLWAMYNNIIFALQKAHPRTWLDQQRMIHWFLMTNATSGQTVSPSVVTQDSIVTESNHQVSPNQLSLLDQIEEMQSQEAYSVNEIETVLGHQVINQVYFGSDFDIDSNIQADEEADMIKVEEVEVEREEETTPMPAEGIDDWANDTWPCLGCNETQAPTAMFFDGQLCHKCYTEKNG
jgi:hypothetical protein